MGQASFINFSSLRNKRPRNKTQKAQQAAVRLRMPRDVHIIDGYAPPQLQIILSSLRIRRQCLWQAAGTWFRTCISRSAGMRVGSIQPLASCYYHHMHQVLECVSSNGGLIVWNLMKENRNGIVTGHYDMITVTQSPVTNANRVLDHKRTSTMTSLY